MGPPTRRSPGDRGSAGRDAAKHLDRIQRTAARVAEQAARAASRRRLSVDLERRATWLATLMGRAA